MSKPAPFKIGDKVTSDFPYKDNEPRGVVRLVTECHARSDFGSGWAVTAVGIPCACCGLTPRTLAYVDADWFKVQP